VDGGTAVGAAVSLSVQIFVAHAPLLKMYKPYAAMYSPALSFAGKLRATRPDFVAFEEVFCPSATSSHRSLRSLRAACAAHGLAPPGRVAHATAASHSLRRPRADAMRSRGHEPRSRGREGAAAAPAAGARSDRSASACCAMRR
jgi:hypothetical protein